MEPIGILPIGSCFEPDTGGNGTQHVQTRHGRRSVPLGSVPYTPRPHRRLDYSHVDQLGRGSCGRVFSLVRFSSKEALN